jgi:hypothetical protein
MPLPTDVSAIVDALLAGVQLALGKNLMGMYLRGSLALGDFIPATSDIDVLALTERRVGDTEFAALAALHARLDALANPYAGRMEMAYIDHAAIWRFEPGLRHATLSQGEALAWSEHKAHWILERWVVRERGVVLFGPHPQPLIDPIAPDELRAAVRARLRDWADWAIQPDTSDWLARSHTAYVVETMCRALYTLSTGALPTKPQAVAWALEALPEPWRATVKRSRAWRADPTHDATIVPEARRFVLWVTERS